jgi:hypothetical protein
MANGIKLFVVAAFMAIVAISGSQGQAQNIHPLAIPAEGYAY